MVAATREATPLFGPEKGREWHHSMLDNVFEMLLEHGAKLSKEERHKYSMHSFRIYLACALFAAGCPKDKIMAILRWKSEEALDIYARMNDFERSDWVALSFTADVDSRVAAHLPQLGPEPWVVELQEAAASGELGRISRLAENYHMSSSHRYSYGINYEKEKKKRQMTSACRPSPRNTTQSSCCSVASAIVTCI